MLFPPPPQTTQKVELNSGRLEARAIDRFEVDAEQVCFPHARNAARLMQASDRNKDPLAEGAVYLLCSDQTLDAEGFLRAKRIYWMIENGPHQMLDGSRLQEDKSRVRTRKSAWNLGLFRRLVVSLGIHWIHLQKNKRKATLNGFLDAMGRHNSETAFRMALFKNPSWMP